MASDPATLWYWGDWAGGTITFSRFLKGCYMDLLYAQFNNGHLSLDEIKTVLGSDFGSSWPTLQKKFKVDPNGLFYNVRAEEEKNKRIAFTESRRNNLKSHKEDHVKTHKDSLMENENRDEIINENWLKWSQLILDDSDWDWQQMRGRKVSQDEMNVFLSVAVRKKWDMETQQAFRISLNGFKVNGHNGQTGVAKIIDQQQKLNALIDAKYGSKTN